MHQQPSNTKVGGGNGVGEPIRNRKSSKSHPSNKNGRKSAKRKSASARATAAAMGNQSISVLGPEKLPPMVRNVLSGDFRETPILQKAKLIKIMILSSSAQDFYLERESIWREVVPEIQQHCVQYGFELSILDPYLHYVPISSDSNQDFSIDPFFLRHLVKEFRNLGRMTDGIYIPLILIGDKYGEFSPPLEIKLEDFDHILSSLSGSEKERRLLDEWYKLDENQIPISYILQHPNEKKKLDLKTKNSLTRLIGYDSQNSSSSNGGNNSQGNKFQQSALETAIRKLFANKETAKNIFAVIRSFEGSKIKPNDKKFPYFADYTDENSPDHSSKYSEKLAGLKRLIDSKVDEANVETISVSLPKSDYQTWIKSKEKERYLDYFLQQITLKLKQLLSKVFDEWPHTPFENNCLYQTMYNEALSHLDWMQTTKAANLIGQQKVINKVKDLILQSMKKHGQLIILAGDEVSGKTAILSEIGHSAKNWNNQLKIIPRFVGLTPTSVFSHDLWRNIYVQLTTCYGVQMNADFDLAYGQDQLKVLISECFATISKSNNPLVLLIDDVHQIKYGRYLGENNIFGNESLAVLNEKGLPPNISIVCTMNTVSASTHSGQLPWEKNQQGKTIIDIESTNSIQVLDITKSSITTKNRKITSEQLSYLKQKITVECQSPYLGSLMAYEASKWASWQASGRQPSVFRPPQSPGPKSLNSVIENKLQQLEKIVGADQAEWICQYLVVSSHGLTETEVLDILSCNKDVIRKLSRNLQSSQIIRFPLQSWLEIRDEIESLLISFIYEDRKLYKFAHSLIENVVKHRYMANSADIKKCHSELSDLFSDSWADMGVSIPADALGNTSETSAPTPPGEVEMEVDQQPEHPPHPHQMAKIVRIQVYPQPLKSSITFAGEDTIYNKRRIRNLWYHLLHSGNIDNLKELAFCNYPYLESVMQACGLSNLFSIVEDIIQQVLHRDLQFLYNQILQPALLALSRDPDQLVTEIIGRLRYTRAENSPFLNSLVEQAMAWVDNYTSQPLLVPLTCWIPAPPVPMVSKLYLRDWDSNKTVLQPTFNHQHVLVSGNTLAPGIILMYHIASQTLVKSFMGHSDRVTSLNLSNNGQFFISTSLDRTVRTWDLIQGQCIRNLCPHSERVLCSLMTHDDQFIITGGADGSAKMICLDNGRIEKTFPDHTGSVCALAITSFSEFLVTGSGDFLVRVWNLETGGLIMKLGGLMAPVTCMTLTENDAFLLVSCEDETVRVFALCSGTELHELQGHDSKVCVLTTSKDDCQVFAGCLDGRLYCYDIHDASVLSIQQCGNRPVADLKVTKDNYFLLSANGSNVYVWNVDQDKHPILRHNLKVHQMAQKDDMNITSIAMSSDHKYSACGTNSGSVALWDLELCQCIWSSVHGPNETVTCLNFTSNITKLLSGNVNGVITIWAMGDGQLLYEYKEHTGSILSIQIYNDSNRVLSLDSNNMMRMWFIASSSGDFEDKTGDHSIEHIPFQLQVFSKLLRLSPNQRDIIGRNMLAPKEVKVISMEEEKAQTKGKLSHNEPIVCMSLNNTGRLLVTGSDDNSLKVWEVENGFLTQVLVGHDAGVICCAVADDDRIVASGDSDNVVIVWEVNNGTILHTFNAHKAYVLTTLAVSSDGTVVFTADRAGWLIAWDSESGGMLSTFNAHMPILEMCCSFDGHRIVLRLENCSHLPILCFHNTPASSLPPQHHLTLTGKDNRTARTHSVSSVGSFGSVSSGHGTMHGGGTGGPNKISPVAATAATAIAGSKTSPSQPKGVDLRKNKKNGTGRQISTKESHPHQTSQGSTPNTTTNTANEITGTPLNNRTNKSPHIGRINKRQTRIFDTLERNRSRASLYGEIATGVGQASNAISTKSQLAKQNSKAGSIGGSAKGGCSIS